MTCGFPFGAEVETTYGSRVHDVWFTAKDVVGGSFDWKDDCEINDSPNKR